MSDEDRRVETDGGAVQVEQTEQSAEEQTEPQPKSASSYLVDLPIEGYEAGERVDYSRFSIAVHPRFRAFVGALADQNDMDGTLTRTRYSRREREWVDIHENGRGKLLDQKNLHQDDASVLLVFPDHSRMFIGKDETATDSGLFGFVVRNSDPIATPDTCDEALDLLKPAGVKQDLVQTGGETVRQGEWWLLPADDEPRSSVFKPGVAARPYGPSPLDNHVPREYAFGATESEFMARFKAEVPERADYFDSVEEVIEWVTKQHRFDEVEDIEIPDHVPTLDELRQWANGVYVRGTLRHRENDHFMENIGDEWHIARTHTMEVFTADIAPDVALNARVD